MTWTLSNGMEVKTWFEPIVYLDGKEISMEDFIDMVFYVLTNSDLEPNDIRLKLVRVIKDIEVVPGLNKGATRLSYKDYGSICIPNWKDV